MIIERVKRGLEELKGLAPITEENKEKLERKIELDFNFNSNNIEGNTLTYGETKLLFLFGKTTGDHDYREYEEMSAHNVAFRLIKEWSKDTNFVLKEKDIRELNKIILVRDFWKEAQTQTGEPTRRQIKVGEYKKYPNHVKLQNGEIFHYANPEEVPFKMEKLMKWYNEEIKSKDFDPIITASIFHHEFVLIHPFDDGNGRLSRLLVNYILMKNEIPPIIIKSEDKKNYLTALNKADTGNKEAFIEYIASQVLNSIDLHIRATKGENIDDKDDYQKKIYFS